VGNAVDATLETGGSVTIGWTADNHALDVFVEDEGPAPAPAFGYP
jgi:anti-sigma regulatory factor (Ser/Thr protein kinase)